MFRPSSAVEGMDASSFINIWWLWRWSHLLGKKAREAFCSQGRAEAHSSPWCAVLSGVADENALAEECQRRGQHTPALAPGPAPAPVRVPSQARPPAPAPAQTPAPSVSTRPQKPPRPAPTAKLVSKSSWEDEEQDRQRVPGNWDAPMTSAGVQEGAGVEQPQSVLPPDPGQQAQKSGLCCCILT